MKKIFGLVIAFFTILFLTGCSRVYIDVGPSQTGYLYQEDIHDSKRYNSGTDYVFHFPLETPYRILKVDYSIQQSTFSAEYTLEGSETKISLPIKAEISYRLKRNPKDNGSLPFSQDKYVKYWMDITGSSPNATNVYKKVALQIEDTAFREAFRKKDENGNLVYQSFDDIERNIKTIRDDAKKYLSKNLSEHYIEIVAVRLNDLEVPKAIADSRSKNLELQQDEINQTREIEMKLRLASMKLVQRVREAINDVMVDKIVASQVDKGYLMVEVLREAAQSGGMNVSITPDFLRYVEDGNGSSTIQQDNLKEAAELFNKLKSMSDKEMQDYFMNNLKSK
tara:strand:- start:16323 stop:17333 length:1011 start_codon:yes stop_codon:yes gene_type:complete